jgi:hypothetical protein
MSLALKPRTANVDGLLWGRAPRNAPTFKKARRFLSTTPCWSALAASGARYLHMGCGAFTAASIAATRAA